jgi:hypothetical protein
MENDHQVKKRSGGEEYLNNFFIEEVGNKKDSSSNYDRAPGSAVPSCRKSNASEYGDKKIGQKTLTPTRVSNPTSKSKKK